MKLPLFLLLVVPLVAFAPSPQTAEGVKLSWDYDFANPTNPTVVSFGIEYGIGPVLTNWNGTNVCWRQYTNTHIVVGQVTNTILTNLQRGQLYYITATAISIDGVVSERSNEVKTNTLGKPGNPNNTKFGF